MGLKLYSAPEVASLLGIELDTLYRYARSGKIRGMKFGKLWRFAEADVEAFVQSRRYMVESANSGPRLLTDLFRRPPGGPPARGELITGSTRISYAHVDLLADRLAHALLARGVQPGDRVLSALPNSVEFVVACLAVWKVRGIVIPEYVAIRPTNLQHILDDARPTVLIVERSLAEQLDDMGCVLNEVKAVFVKDRTFTLSGLDDVAVESLDAVLECDASEDQHLPQGAEPDEVVSITYTSGSTGAPKGVMQTHESWLAGAEFTRDYVGLSPNDLMVIPLPFHHGLAFRQLLAYPLADASIGIANDLYQALKLIREHKPTALLLVPAAGNIALEHFSPILEEASGFLRYVEIGSAAMPPERLEHLRRILPNTRMHLPYGLTEARVAYLKCGRDGLLNRIATVSPGLKLSVVDTDGRAIRRGQTGEIHLQGRGLMKGYWGQTAAEIRDLTANGLWTGDMGRIDDQGEIELLGRLDDMLKIGGRKVNPLEVEMVLNRHPAVAESAVIGLPDPKGILEQELHAFVVAHRAGSVNESELLAHCREHVELYKTPARIHFRTTLPKTPVGKLLREKLTA